MLPLLLVLHLLFFPLPSSSDSNSLPGCPNLCGNVSIPFPFGIKPGCHLPGFRLTCNNFSTSSPNLLLPTSSSNMEVSSISLSAASALVLAPIARNCIPSGHANISIDVSNLPFSLSSARNRFTAVGCDSMAVYGTANSYISGCLSFCSSLERIAYSSCSGFGCCQSAIPGGLQRIDASLNSLKSSTSNSTECSYAFIVDKDQFHFAPSNISDFSATTMPVVLDWAVENGTCAAGNNSCGRNAFCSVSSTSKGYLCSCNSGFSGNPYLPNGCKDINECTDPRVNPCSGICHNTQGGYVCSCPRGYLGDGTKSGSGCTKETKRFPLVEIVAGIGMAFLFLLVGGSYFNWLQKKRRLQGLKEKFFEKNGGVFLKQQLAAHDGHANAARIYSSEELERATKNYSDDRVLGRGGNGIVYKGVLPDTHRTVAIKKSRRIDGSQIEQFINEVVVLSQVIHKHVVRMLGCCLETQVPLLVYEYVPNGTLHHHLHNFPGSLSWEARLRIASETAGAFAYLHSAIERPIFHRDIKAANILLDENYMAKVTDFGASRLIPLDRMQLTTMVQGTLGYLDPEYFQTGQLTEKSDVYSFGVVLAELLTGQKPISAARKEAEKNLGVYFVRKIKEGCLLEIVEERVKNEGKVEQLMAVAEVTMRCLMMSADKRPTMREVAAELERARQWRRWKGSWRAGSEAEDRNGPVIGGFELGMRFFAGMLSGGGDGDSLFFGSRNSSRHSASGSVGGDESLGAHSIFSFEMQR